MKCVKMIRIPRDESKIQNGNVINMLDGIL